MIFALNVYFLIVSFFVRCIYIDFLIQDKLLAGCLRRWPYSTALHLGSRPPMFFSLMKLESLLTQKLAQLLDECLNVFGLWTNGAVVQWMS